MPDSLDPHRDARLQVTLWRGSPRDALDTFWLPIRERRGPVWAHVLIMAGLNCIIAFAITLGAVAFHGAPFRQVYAEIVPFSQCIGFCVMGLHLLGEALFGRVVDACSLTVRSLFHGASSVLGVAIGFALAGLLGFGVNGPLAFVQRGVVASVGIALITSYLINALVGSRKRAAEAQALAERERARSLAAEARVFAANLKLLQAQIEPHFLFNTLANVLGMIDTRPRDARHMLEDFIFYLRASLDTTRGAATTLGHELELLRRYLSIFRFRMGDRLSFQISCPDTLAALPMAPMLLQPLVENAIEHGLEPKVEGGCIDIQVKEAGESITVAIADTGLGFVQPDAKGVGLANVRERLQLMYGAKARLDILEHVPSGTCVVVTLPRAALPVLP